MKFLFLSLIILLSTAQSSIAITNSSPAENDSSVVAIRTDASENGNIVPAFCNATLLSNRILITAAHCVSNAYLLNSNTIQVDIGSYRYVKKEDGRVVRVGYVPHTSETKQALFIFTQSLTSKLPSIGFNGTIPPAEDFALIILTSNLTLKEDFSFAKIISRRNFQNLKNSFSGTNPHTITINYEEPSADVKRIAFLENITYSSSGTFESKSNSKVEEGDSGAPLFVQIANENYVAGVVKGEAHSFFSKWDVYAPISDKVCDIASNLGNPNIYQLICN